MNDAYLLGASGDGVELIRLEGITAIGHHGYYEHERRDGQPFVVDVTVQLARRAATDDLEGTAHYGELAADVAAQISGEPVDLIESLAHRIAEVCLTRPAVAGVVVTVHKPEAPMPVSVRDASVVVVRTRR